MPLSQTAACKPNETVEQNSSPLQKMQREKRQFYPKRWRRLDQINAAVNVKYFEFIGYFKPQVGGKGEDGGEGIGVKLINLLKLLT